MDIFSRVRLRPSQMRTVADWRFADASLLLRKGGSAHTNGAMYLAGFVVECLLKAKLLEENGWLQKAWSTEGLSKAQQHLWWLCYRSHDLDAILARLPMVTERLSRQEQHGSMGLANALKAICAQWTVHARYATRRASIDEAEGFLGRIKELRKWLR